MESKFQRKILQDLGDADRLISKIGLEK